MATCTNICAILTFAYFVRESLGGTVPPEPISDEPDGIGYIGQIDEVPFLESIYVADRTEMVASFNVQDHFDVRGVSLTLKGIKHSHAGELEVLLEKEHVETATLHDSQTNDSRDLDGDYTFSDGGIKTISATEPIGDHCSGSNCVDGECPVECNLVSPGTYKPDGFKSLADHFGGLRAQGRWFATLKDNKNLDEGTLKAIVLTLKTDRDELKSYHADLSGTAVTLPEIGGRPCGDLFFMNADSMVNTKITHPGQREEHMSYHYIGFSPLTYGTCTFTVAFEFLDHTWGPQRKLFQATYVTSCGNGSLDEGEECDDGNHADGDGCDITCHIEEGSGPGGVCGDGKLWSTESCDDANVHDGDGCSSQCQVEDGYSCSGSPSICEGCGNGVIDVGETCDDGNRVGSDGCDGSCKEEPSYFCTGSPSQCFEQTSGDQSTCGDAVIESGETCDDGNLKSGDGCSNNCAVEPGFECRGYPSVCSPKCGNKRVDQGEHCDDGNMDGGDGCSSKCFIEDDYFCLKLSTFESDSWSNCTSRHGPYYCGDGIIWGSEECDDGNQVAKDGCSPDCVVEIGFTCYGFPSKCDRLCGNGVTDGCSEECDDGNSHPGDGCDGSCQIETGYYCNGQPSSCREETTQPVCGNGVLEHEEECDFGTALAVDGCNTHTCQKVPGYICHGWPRKCTKTCGNGLLDACELCDDGNDASGDGCSSSCESESGYLCTGEPSRCTAESECGDGLVGRGEECDDLNFDDDDGCSKHCVVEESYKCAGSPSVCLLGCGDGKLSSDTERCDDGNDVSGDGCGYLCAIEEGWACATVNGTSVCHMLNVCGDGIIDDTEQCDDENTANGDGCSADCAVEQGWACQQLGSSKSRCVKASANLRSSGGTSKWLSIGLPVGLGVLLAVAAALCFWKRRSKTPPSTEMTLRREKAPTQQSSPPSRAVSPKPEGKLSLPLHVAATKGNLQVVEYLLHQKADVYATDAKMRTPLHLSVMHGHHDVTRMLLDCGSRIDARDAEGNTPLQWAAMKDDEIHVEMLCSAHASVASANTSENTPLHWAAHNGSYPTVDLLLNNGAAVDAPDVEGRTPLHWCAIFMLQPQGRIVGGEARKTAAAASVLTDEERRTSLMDSHTAVVQLLLQRGANVNSKDMNGRTPLHWCCIFGHIAAAQYFLDCGADPNISDSTGLTPLHLTVEHGHLDIVAMLVDKGARLDSRDKHGVTPLHRAVYYRQISAVGYLLGRGASVSWVDNDGMSCLHIAAANGDMSLVAFLVGEGAEIDALDKSRNTPVHWASHSGHMDVADYLARVGGTSP